MHSRTSETTEEVPQMIRIRVNPGGMAGGYGGYGGVGAVNAQTYYNSQLNNQRQVSNLRLDYERQLWEQKLKAAKLEAAIQYGGQGGYGSPYGSPWGSPFGGALMGAGMPIATGVPPMALPMAGGFGGLGTLPFTSGSGQTNITNQVAAGAGTQTVSNTNNYDSRVHVPPQSPWGMPFGGSPYGASPWGMPFGGQNSGGLLGRLFGGW